MKNFNKSGYEVEELIRYMELELNRFEARKLAKQIETVADIWLANDYYFLLPHYASRYLPKEDVEKIRQVIVRQKPCPSKALLSHYALGYLDTKDVKAYIENHVKGCEVCSQNASQIKQARERLCKVIDALEGHVSSHIIERLREKTIKGSRFEMNEDAEKEKVALHFHTWEDYEKARLLTLEHGFWSHFLGQTDLLVYKEDLGALAKLLKEASLEYELREVVPITEIGEKRASQLRR